MLDGEEDFILEEGVTIVQREVPEDEEKEVWNFLGKRSDGTRMETADDIPMETDNFYCECEIGSFSHSKDSRLAIGFQEKKAENLF